MTIIKNNVFFLLIAITLSFFVLPAHAVEIEVQGEGSTEITQDIGSVQYKAKQEAIRKAITTALERVLGADAMKDERVQQRFADVVSQLSVYKVKQTDFPQRYENRYIITTKLIIDETKFRKLISDMGIALHTNIVRSNTILTIMDEFFSVPSDLNNPAPLREVTVFKKDTDVKYKEGEALSRKSSEAKSVSARDQESGSVKARHKESGSVSAKQSESASASGRSSGRVLTDDGYASGSSSADAKYAQKSSINAKRAQDSSLDAKHDRKSSLDASSSRENSLNYGKFVNASASDHVFFTNIKEYQPRNPVAAQSNYTIAALQSAFQTYDIKILDNALFRSKYFGNRVVTVDELEKSSDLAKYAKFAKSDAKADFFGIGISNIVDRGVDSNTGMYICDGMVTVRVYATTDAESIASGALTESASGGSPDQCRTNVANKIGGGLGNEVSNKIQEYWKKRQMYGSEMIVLLMGNFPPMMRIQFTNTLKSVKGASNVKQRTAEPGKYEFVVSYSGSDPLADAIFMQIASSPMAASFSNYDFATEGNQITFKPMTPEPAPARVKTPPKKGKK